MKSDGKFIVKLVSGWHARAAFVGMLALASLSAGCEEEIVQGTRVDSPAGEQEAAETPAASNPALAPTTAATPANPADAPAEEDTAPPVLSYVDSDFVELDTENRDPFRRFLAPAVVTTDVVQRQVIMPDTPIDEMRLIAVVGGSRRRAMLQDSTRIGFIVKEGEYLGREEVLQTGGAEAVPVTLNWRVARIRTSSVRHGTSAEVVLTRTDPRDPDQTPLTRAIPLYEAEDPSQQNLLSQ